MENVFIILAVAIVAAITSFFLGRFLGKTNAEAPADTTSHNFFAEVTRLQERERGLVEEAARQRELVQVSADKLSSLQTEHANARERLAAAAERENALNRLISERDEQLKGLQTQLKSEFENIATSILKTATEQLSENSEKSIATILDPLNKQIAEFKQKIDATHTEDTKQRSALEAQIKQVTQANQNVGLQAEALTKALKGDSQLRGRWAEIRLERILEKSGLVRGREFVVQGGDFNIKSEEGGSQRPDVIILLPENRHFVIDSKLSLVDYLDYESSETDEQRGLALKKLVHSCRTHIDGLAKKKYQYADAINSHDLIFMFMPIEGVVALTAQNDENIFEYAWNKRIVLVSPSTLFMAMQTVHSIWRYERQNLNAQAIALQAGQLYDKLSGFVEDLNEVSQKINGAANAHSEAMKKLATGKGNALSRTQKLKSMGASSKKNLPTVTIDGDKLLSFDEDTELEALISETSTAALSTEPEDSR